MALERCTADSLLPLEVMKVSTPLKVETWRAALRSHPDRRFAQYIVGGLEHGFHIGFDRSRHLVPSERNLPSTNERVEEVTRYIEKELSLGRVVGPLRPNPIWQVNRIGVIPKGHTPGRWRMITDLSHPPGASVNDGIDPNVCTLSYVTVEAIAVAAEELGEGALLAKVDIESAYRLVPVHPEDRPLLAIRWKGDVYVDTRLPFGLRSAPKVFTAVADGLEWIARQRGVGLIRHYLDDYIILGRPQDASCQRDLETFKSTCEELGVPLAEHKQEGPSTRLTFLGIEIDTVSGHLRLPVDKLDRLRTLLGEWKDRKVCTRRELESLIGSLNHACKVVKPGRSFLRRMIDLLHRAGIGTTPRPHHHIRLNREFRSDLQWWRKFIIGWNGVSYWKKKDRPPIEVVSDASGHWGCGAWSGRQWLSMQWPDGAKALPIATKEFLPILISGVLWGHQWTKRGVQYYCDNEAVVAVIRSRTSKHPHLMHLLRCLFLVEAHFDMDVTCTHIPGKYNVLADDLSRNRACAFLSKVPGASLQPTPVPAPLLELLLDPELDWLSPRWTAQFSTFVTRA